MLRNRTFRRATRHVDALLIWGAAISFVVWLAGVIEGRGMAVSLLIALAALPLALLSALIFQHRAAVGAYLYSLVASPSPQSPSRTNDNTGNSGPERLLGATSGDAHERLHLFIIDYVEPACSAQLWLQRGILRRLCDNQTVLLFSEQALETDYRHCDFNNAYEQVTDLSGSPMPEMSVGDMIDCISKLEQGAYWAVCERGKNLAKSSGITPQSDPIIGPLWTAWREKHNSLVLEYDKLKRESRFGTPLYRPQKPSRWGGLLGLLS